MTLARGVSRKASSQARPNATSVPTDPATIVGNAPEPSPRLREQFYAMLETHQREADAEEVSP